MISTVLDGKPMRRKTKKKPLIREKTAAAKVQGRGPARQSRVGARRRGRRSRQPAATPSPSRPAPPLPNALTRFRARSVLFRVISNPPHAARQYPSFTYHTFHSYVSGYGVNAFSVPDDRNGKQNKKKKQIR